MRTSSTSAGATIPATARSSPTAACAIASTSATRCRGAKSSTGAPRTTTCSSYRSGASSRSCSMRSRLPDVRSAVGPDSVRGFRESRLGPKDNFGRPYGGNIKTVAQTELLLPIPEKWRNSARFSLFYDIGNVVSAQTIVFRATPRIRPPGPLDPNFVPAEIDYGFKYSELKQAVGVA